MTRLEDLTPAERRQISTGTAKPATVKIRALPAPADRHITDTTIADGHNRWKCVPCGEIFKAWATVEKHIDQAHGGGRIEWLWQ